MMACIARCFVAAYLLVTIGTETADLRAQARLLIPIAKAIAKELLKRIMFRTLGNPHNALHNTWNQARQFGAEFMS